MPIPIYILKRILISIPTILIVSILGFLLMRYDITLGPIDVPTPSGASIHLMDKIRIKNPIDPLASLRNNPQISRAALESETRRLGLDKPMVVQYWLWLRNLLNFNFKALREGHFWEIYQPNLGKTFTGDDVFSLLMTRAANTFWLNVLSMLITWLIALPMGIYAALHWRSYTDRFLTLLSSIGMALPSFVVALLAAVFAVKTGWFPLGGITSDDFSLMNPAQQMIDIIRHLALPVFAITIGGIAGLQRQMRGNLLDVLEAEYVRTARAKGLPENKVIYAHAVRTAVNPLITLLGYEFSALLSGSVLIETVLGFPGLGALIYRAVQETDTNLVMASLVMSAVMLVVGNLFADILLKFVDPRIELE